MCQSLDDIAKGIDVKNLQSVLSFLSSATPSCSRHPNCDGISCVVAGSYTADIIVDPCQESVRVLVRNVSSGILFNRAFPESGQYPLPFTLSGFSPMLQVGIEKYNFSMKLSVSCPRTC